MFQDVLDKYSILEPEGNDTWNPLLSKTEFWHRIRLFHALRWALNKIDIPPKEIKVLDVGSGVGRSTRALLEFGVKPENITGIDLRPSAINYAKKTNPAIDFQVIERFEDWERLGEYHLCTQCTTFSSIKGEERRLKVGAMMEDVLRDEGFIFWWDQAKANEFAGNDLLTPSQYFKKSALLAEEFVPIRPTLFEASRSKNKIVLFILDRLQVRIGYPKTHRMALFKKT